MNILRKLFKKRSVRPNNPKIKIDFIGTENFRISIDWPNIKDLTQEQVVKHAQSLADGVSMIFSPNVQQRIVGIILGNAKLRKETFFAELVLTNMSRFSYLDVSHEPVVPADAVINDELL